MEYPNILDDKMRKLCFELPSRLSFICFSFAFNLSFPTGATTDHIPEERERWCEPSVCCTAE